jgi:hypothetical protein
MSPFGVSTARLKKQTPPMADTPCKARTAAVSGDGREIGAVNARELRQSLQFPRASYS